MKNNKDKDNNGLFFAAGLFIGGLFGGFIIFLLSTKKGKKIAKEFIKKMAKSEEKTQKNINTYKKQTMNLVKNLQNLQSNNALEDLSESNLSAIKKRFFKKNGRSLAS